MDTRPQEAKLTIESVKLGEKGKNIKCEGTYGPNKSGETKPITVYIRADGIKSKPESLTGAVLNKIRFGDTEGEERDGKVKKFIHVKEAWVKLSNGKNFHYTEPSGPAPESGQGSGPGI